MNWTISRNFDLHLKMGLRTGQKTAKADGVIAKPDNLNNESFSNQCLPIQHKSFGVQDPCRPDII